MLKRRDESLVDLINTSKTEKKEQVEDIVILAEYLVGNISNNSLELSKNILEKVDFQWKKLLQFNQEEIMSISKISNEMAIRLELLIHVHKRFLVENSTKIEIIKSPKCVFEKMRPYFSNLPHEEFYALFLNNAKKILKISRISIGGLTSTLADGRIIFNKALEIYATGIILCHNHPSGILNASHADISLTKNLLQFGKFIDIQILDHIIFTDNGYLSLLEEGLLS